MRRAARVLIARRWVRRARVRRLLGFCGLLRAPYRRTCACRDATWGAVSLAPRERDQQNIWFQVGGPGVKSIRFGEDDEAGLPRCGKRR